MDRSGELERIYQAVLSDLDKWDGQKPLEDFVAEILEKRLLLSKEEAKVSAQQLLAGIEKYKHTKEFLLEHPEVVKKAIDSVDKSLTKNLIDKVLEIAMPFRRNNDGK